MKYILLLTALLTSTTIAAATFDETMAAAKQGNAYEQHKLGWMYANGEGVPENDAEVVKWYRKAADQRACICSAEPRHCVCQWRWCSRE